MFASGNIFFKQILSPNAIQPNLTMCQYKKYNQHRISRLKIKDLISNMNQKLYKYKFFNALVCDIMRFFFQQFFINC